MTGLAVAVVGALLPLGSGGAAHASTGAVTATTAGAEKSTPSAALSAEARAAETGEPVEVLAERTQYSQVFAQPDGGFTFQQPLLIQSLEGLLWSMTATSADGGCRGWVIIAVFSLPQGVVEGVDGLAQESESDMRVDADVGVAEQFLDEDEFDACSRWKVAAQWRRSWNRMWRSPARSRKRRVRLAGARGRPGGVVRTSPLSLQSDPAVSRPLPRRAAAS